MKNKILVFNGYYIPAKNYGGPTASLATIVENCSDLFEFYIIAANHDFNDNTVFKGIHDGWNQVGQAKVLYVDLKEMNYHKKRIKMIIDALRPDMVWLMGILVPADKWYVADVCRRLSIPYLISPRGEVNEQAIHLKFIKKIIVILLANLLSVYEDAWYHATSKEEIYGLKKYYKASGDRIIFAPNISNNLAGSDRWISKKCGQLNIIYVSRIHKIKNLLVAIKAVNQLKGEIVFDIYGPMEDIEYWSICEAEINKSPENVQIRYRGVLDREQVARTIGKYHCMILPTASENYGHVVAEALSVSCPVIISKGTTPWDSIDNVAGKACHLEKEEEFVQALEQYEKMNNQQYDECIKTTKEYYNKKITEDNAVERHNRMLKHIIGSGKNGQFT